MSKYDKANETKGDNYQDGRVKQIQELCQRGQVPYDDYIEIPTMVISLSDGEEGEEGLQREALQWVRGLRLDSSSEDSSTS